MTIPLMFTLNTSTSCKKASVIYFSSDRYIYF
jgi:hypothetical protein